MKREYKRHLPHQVPEDSPIFLTWNLKGAMPRAALKRLRHEREELNRQPLRAGESLRTRAIRFGKLLFARSDSVLDRAVDGPMDLKDPVAANIVEAAILFGVGDRYDLFAWCVMANHVHVLLTPHWQLAEVTQGIKGFTAREINRTQGVRGRVFWMDESYDHWARDDDELLRIVGYIESNPVKAGLCQTPEEWPWSSARFRCWWPSGEVLKREMVARCRQQNQD